MSESRLAPIKKRKRFGVRHAPQDPAALVSLDADRKEVVQPAEFRAKLGDTFTQLERDYAVLYAENEACKSWLLSLPRCSL